jgi:glycosyltransferase involved in cell wall biosynthesis
MVRRIDGAFVNGADGETYLRHLGFKGPAFVVPYVVDIAAYTGATPVPDEPALKVLYAGQLIERKGIRSFTETLARWCELHPDIKVEFTIAGEGPERERLESQATPASLVLKFAGRLDSKALAMAYRNASICAFQTLGDEWGVVVNEALSAGVPILASTHSGAAKELVQDGINGWLFDPYDADSLYEGIDRALNTDSSALSLMSKHARESVVHLTPEAMASRIAAAISSLPRMLASA